MFAAGQNRPKDAFGTNSLEVSDDRLMLSENEEGLQVMPMIKSPLTLAGGASNE